MPPIIDMEDRDEVYLAHHFHLQRVMDAKAGSRRESEVVVVDVKSEDRPGRTEDMGKEWWEDQRNVALGCMEKGQAMGPPQHPAVAGYNRRHGRVQMLRAAKRAVLLAGVVVMALWTWYGIGTGWTGQWESSHRQSHHEPITTTTTGGAAEERGFKWDDLTPLPNISWTPCFNPPYVCARFLVPLDYTNLSDPRQVAIALTALPASVPPSSPDYAGPVLLNPGGPGGSGVDFVLANGARLHPIIGQTHTLIGFDPRGINNTTPQSTCFPSEAARRIWSLRSGFMLGSSGGSGSDGDTASSSYGEVVLRTEHARSRSLGRVCADYVERGDSAADFTGTPNVARDMLEIVDASWTAGGRAPGAAAAEEEPKPGLRYWGFSYGSALGATFALMFPDRVDRMVLDGNVDLDDYYHGGWTKNLHDSDKVLDAFYRFCSAAGPDVCAFSASSPEEVKARLHRLLQSLEQSPIPVFDPEEAPDLVSADDVKTLVFLCFYQPIRSFPILATALRDLERGNATKVARLLHHPFLPKIPGRCDGTGDGGDAAPNTGTEADSMILCTDGPTHVGASIQTMRDYLKLLESQSMIAAGPWARIQMACVGQRIKARGLPRPAQLVPGSGVAERVDTRKPILFIGNDADPVTPLGNARTMQKWFGGSRVLRVEDGLGHCTWAVKSRCVERVVGGYFESGEIGGDGDAEVVCGVDEYPFGKKVEGTAVDGVGWHGMHVPGYGRW